MTRWTITYAINKCRKKTGATWEYLKLTGAKGAESRGIVDFVAMRKNHRKPDIAGLKEGDLFDVVLIQSKGGSASMPTQDDIKRLRTVGEYYHAKHVVLSSWKKGSGAALYILQGDNWKGPVDPVSIFE